jgi:hypothetical protein
MKKILLALLFACSSNAFATNINPSTQQEIQYLFKALESSDCKFNRNGSWYAPTDASVHLQKKYKYMVDHNYISTAESFIDNVASKSSMSGKAYEVKCGDGKPVESKQWFINTLKSYRTEKHD